MTNLSGKNVLLGINGGIAAYKAAELTRLLTKENANVRVCMTASAAEFVKPLTFQALSGNPVHTDLFDLEAEAAMGHIELAKWADIILIAPATANTMARIANGMADDLLSTIILASEASLLIAPAMNQAMWRHQRTQENVRKLEQDGVNILGPAAGEQACGDTGPGRMLEPAEIITLLTASQTPGALNGVTVLLTAGPTREAIDPVRYITNRSSGKMGYAIARAAADMGASVKLVSGPVNLAPLQGIETTNVESAREMLQATKALASAADIFIATAAVADYAPETAATQKIKKTAANVQLQLKLSKNPDILATISHAFPHLFTVGFAAETHDVEAYARKKLQAKKLDMIAANQVGKGQGFEVDSNALTVIWEGGKTELPLSSKQQLAQKLLQLIIQHYRKAHENR